MVKLVDFDKNASSWKPHKIQLSHSNLKVETGVGGHHHHHHSILMKNTILKMICSLPGLASPNMAMQELKGCRTWTAKSERKQRAAQ